MFHIFWSAKQVPLYWVVIDWGIFSSPFSALHEMSSSKMQSFIHMYLISWANQLPASTNILQKPAWGLKSQKESGKGRDIYEAAIEWKEWEDGHSECVPCSSHLPPGSRLWFPDLPCHRQIDTNVNFSNPCANHFAKHCKEQLAKGVLALECWTGGW